MAMPKSAFYCSILLIATTGFCSFQKLANAPIVGTWHQTTIQAITKKGMLGKRDTVTTHPKRTLLILTSDLQYHYITEHGGNTDGTYSIDGNLLKTASPKNQMWGSVVIDSLNEHTLITRSHGVGIESGIKVETVITYSR